MIYKFSKRFIDVVISTMVLIILSPLFILIIILLKLTGEHEVFFMQKRMGYKNKPFYIWKFATMLKNSANIGTGVITMKNDARVTKLGKLLRLSKINELPQIINVLKGEMSIVGPRPLMEVSFDLYSDEIKYSIYNCKPGITGVGSLVFRNEEEIVSKAKDPASMYADIYPYKGKLELWYQRNASVTTDCSLIFITAWAVVFPESKLICKIFPDIPMSHTSSFGNNASREEKYWISRMPSATVQV